MADRKEVKEELAPGDQIRAEALQCLQNLQALAKLTGENAQSALAFSLRVVGDAPNSVVEQTFPAAIAALHSGLKASRETRALYNASLQLSAWLLGQKSPGGE